MKLKLIVIKNLEPVLAKMAKQDVDIKAAYKLSKIFKVLGEELKLIEEFRLKLVKKYAGEEQPDPKNIEVLPENKEQFIKEYEEFLQQETDVSFEKLSLSELEGISITPFEGMVLSEILKD